MDQFVEKELERFREKLKSDLERKFLTAIKPTRSTTLLTLRYDWAAKRICYRTPYAELAKEEAANGYTETRIKQTVGKIITEIR